MKRFIVLAIAFLAASASVASAQENVRYGGQKGDFVFTIGNSSELGGKYMLSDRWALEAGLHIGMRSEEISVDFEDVVGSTSDYLPTDYDYNSVSFNPYFEVGVNYMLLPGERMQAYVGGGILGSIVAYNTTYLRNISTDEYDNSFTYGLYALFGVEYFLTPNVSIGGEASLRVTTGSNEELRFYSQNEYSAIWTINTFNISTIAANSIMINFYF
jgi:opacity protein-like surface antigen